MVFASLFFIYAFFLLNLVFYFFVKNEGIAWRNGVMLIFSLIFYAFVGPKYILLLVGETLISYLCALGISKAEGAGKKVVLGIDLLCLLGLLGYFKYAGFLVSNYNLLPFPDLKVPEVVSVVGISFYTFQLISYTVDVFRGDVKPQKSFFKLLLYTSMFHQCIAGPIIRYSVVAKELSRRKASGTDVYEGILRFATGLAKKAILANGVAAVAKSLIPAGDLTSAESIQVALANLDKTPALSILFGIFCFTLQIYLDFSAYSDMAIGMGRMLGFHYPENFNYPYTAVTVTDFWRRWHISLSSFFRDYVYIPLGGNRKGLIRTILNLLVVWFLTGMWHGASWNFILWGLYYFVILVIEKIIRYFIESPSGKAVPAGTEEKRKKRTLLPPALYPLGYLYTMIAVILGWGIFYFEDFSLLLGAAKNLFLIGKWNSIHTLAELRPYLFDDHTILTFKTNVFLLVIAVLACFPLWKLLRDQFQKIGKKNLFVLYFSGAVEIIFMVLCMLLATMALAGNTYNPFLYFRF